ENLTKSFTGDTINNLLGPFTDFLNENRQPLTATIANLYKLSGEIAEGNGTVGKLIKDPTLYNSALTSLTNMQQVADEIKITVADARRVVDQIQAGQGTVGKMFKDDTLWRETTEALTNAKEILQKINRGEGSVGKMISGDEFYKNAKLTLQKLDKATE